MHTLYSVIDDLYSYTIGTIVRLLTNDARIHEAFLLNPRRTAHDVLPQAEEQEEAVLADDAIVQQTSFRAIDSILKTRAVSEPIAHSVMYVGSARAPLFLNPTKEFDAVIRELSYGTMVMVLEEKGRFARISQNGSDGWTLRDDLIDRAAYVYPEFQIGEENGADEPNTLRTRAVIGDAFHGGEAEFPLQAGEYAYYKLVRKGLAITWPDVRPRTPGMWHTILKGVSGVSIGVIPKVGSIMEYTQPDETGHLAYVEAVFPDESIVLSEANYPDRGIYNERTLVKEEWTMLNPLFLQIT